MCAPEPSPSLTEDTFSYYEGNRRRRVHVALAQIVRFEGDSNYTWVHLPDQSPHLLSRTLTHYETELPTFIRISKADLVNPLFIATVGYTATDDPLHRRVLITLSTGEQLTCSRRRGLLPLIRTLHFPFDSF